MSNKPTEQTSQQTDITDSVFDPLSLMEVVDNDMELLDELLSLFEEDTPRLLDELEQAVTAGDGPTVQRLAHTLKGSLANFHAAAAVDAAFRLEQMGRDSALQDAPQALDTLRHHIERLIPALHAFIEKRGVSP